MTQLRDDFRLISWLAMIPGLISVLVLIVGVAEPPHQAVAGQPPLQWHDLENMGTGYWMVVGVGASLTLARFSEAFLILRARTPD